MILLIVKPIIKTMLVKRVVALAFGDVAQDIGIVQRDAVWTGNAQRILANGAIYHH